MQLVWVTLGSMGGGATTTDLSLVMPKAGDLLAGKYTIVRVLGEGGMGIVYEATHMRLRQRVAVKMLLPAMLQHEVIVSRFEREARAAAQLRGRHCARVNDVDVTSDGLPYMVMDFLEGHDLEVELQRRGRLTVGDAVDYVLQACAAMVEAHHLGIVHRDLKPSNLFLAMDGENGQVVKVLDFGISKVATTESDAKLTAIDSVMGTPFYMSPEQVKASHSVDGRSDIWSLGVILYELLSGIVPWTGSSPHAVAAMIVTEDPPDLRTLPGMGDLSAELVAIVHKTLQRDPKNRFATVKELAAALGPYASSGTAGRVFADSIPESRPRVAVARTSEDSVKVGTAAPTQVSSEPAFRVSGVSEDRMAPEQTGTTPGWSPPMNEPTRSRVGLIVAVGGLLALVSIGATVLILKRPASSAAAMTEPSASVKAAPVQTEATATASPSATENSATAATTIPTSSASAKPSSGPAATVRTTATSKPVASTTAPSAAPTPAPTHHPTAPKSSASDKPLFL